MIVEDFFFFFNMNDWPGGLGLLERELMGFLHKWPEVGQICLAELLNQTVCRTSPLGIFFLEEVSRYMKVLLNYQVGLPWEELHP